MQLRTVGQPISARYHPPFTPWSFWRNEISFPVSDPGIRNLSALQGTSINDRLGRNQHAAASEEVGSFSYSDRWSATCKLDGLYAIKGIKHLVFATYLATRKYESLRKDGRAALLIGSGIEPFEQQRAGLIVTAHGQITDVPDDEHQLALAAHIERHPEFEDFFTSPDCALLSMEVSAYQLVTSSDEVRWCYLENLSSANEWQVVQMCCRPIKAHALFTTKTFVLRADA